MSQANDKCFFQHAYVLFSIIFSFVGCFFLPFDFFVVVEVTLSACERHFCIQQQKLEMKKKMEKETSNKTTMYSKSR